MKEKFRDKNYGKKIKVSYVIEENGTKRKEIWECDQQVLISKIIGIVEDYQQQGLMQTLRGYYYDLVGFIPNSMEIYKRIGALITDLRYSGEIDWNAMEDRNRMVQIPSEWENVNSIIESAIYNYRLPRWSDQDIYLELFSEKDTMYPRLNPLTRKYHIPFNINRGYASSSVIYNLSKRLVEKIEEGKSIVLLYVGDHDPSGLDMIHDIRQRVTEFITGMSGYAYDKMSEVRQEQILEELDIDFQIIPVALTLDQVKKYKLPPNPAKLSDSRAEKYIKKYGKISWELDALKPQIMNKIVEEEILKHIDLDKYDAWIKKEKEQKKALEEFGETLN